MLIGGNVGLAKRDQEKSHANEVSECDIIDVDRNKVGKSRNCRNLPGFIRGARIVPLTVIIGNPAMEGRPAARSAVIRPWSVNEGKSNRKFKKMFIADPIRQEAIAGVMRRSSPNP